MIVNLKGTTNLAKGNWKPWAILDDWIPPNSLLDSHDYANPMANENKHAEYDKIVSNVRARSWMAL